MNQDQEIHEEQANGTQREPLLASTYGHRSNSVTRHPVLPKFLRRQGTSALLLFESHSFLHTQAHPLGRL